jgi:hypothetical protein
MNGETKHCARCRRDVSRSEFGGNKRSPDGLQHWCKACCRAYWHERRAAGKARLQAGSVTTWAAAAAAILASVLSLALFAQAQSLIQAPTRDTPYDWQCQDAQGAKISDHQRFDTALAACLNNPAGAYLQGGRYRINRTTTEPAPEPAPTLGSATLRWTPPTQNTDGSTLTNLKGFRIAYGTSPTALTQSIEVANAAITSYVVSDLAPGTWYFAVRSYNTAGAESINSNVASKTL